MPRMSPPPPAATARRRAGPRPSRPGHATVSHNSPPALTAPPHPRPPRHPTPALGGRRELMDKLLTVEEAAERLGTSVRFVRRLIHERRIAYTKLGRHVRIAASDLDAFIT